MSVGIYRGHRLRRFDFTTMSSILRRGWHCEPSKIVNFQRAMRVVVLQCDVDGKVKCFKNDVKQLHICLNLSDLCAIFPHEIPVNSQIMPISCLAT